MTILNLLLALYIGAILGGFATALVPRLAGMRSHNAPRFAPASWLPELSTALSRLSKPGSSCTCGRLLSTTEKAPILGWALTRGRCRTCGTTIPAAYPLCELMVWGFVTLMTVSSIHLAPGAFALEALVPASFLILAILLLPVAPLATYLASLAVAGYLHLLVGADILTPAVLLVLLIAIHHTKWSNSSFAHAMAGLSIAFISEALPMPFELASLLIGIAAILCLDLPRYFGIRQTA